MKALCLDTSFRCVFLSMVCGFYSSDICLAERNSNLNSFFVIVLGFFVTSFHFCYAFTRLLFFSLCLFILFCEYIITFSHFVCFYLRLNEKCLVYQSTSITCISFLFFFVFVASLSRLSMFVQFQHPHLMFAYNRLHHVTSIGWGLRPLYVLPTHLYPVFKRRERRAEWKMRHTMPVLHARHR